MRGLSTQVSRISAQSLFKKSCYNKIDFKIHEDHMVHQAVKKFSAFNIGCLAVTNQHNHVVGVLSERDYIHKVSSVGRDASCVKIKEVCTYAPSMVIARQNDTIEQCMNKMVANDIRHLLVVDESSSECVGLISIKDVIKELIHDKNKVITRLSDFRTGRGGYFGSE